MLRGVAATHDSSTADGLGTVTCDVCLDQLRHQHGGDVFDDVVQAGWRKEGDAERAENCAIRELTLCGALELT